MNHKRHHLKSAQFECVNLIEFYVYTDEKKLCDKLFRYNSVMENAEHTNRYYKKKKTKMS